MPDDARVFHEEIFGPVAPVGGFESEEEAIARANDTEYGLVAYVFTRDIKRALRVCEGLETGMVGLNQGMVSNAGAPFGGVKQSGIGREGGHEGLEEFLETKYVAVNLSRGSDPLEGVKGLTCAGSFHRLRPSGVVPRVKACPSAGSLRWDRTGGWMCALVFSAPVAAGPKVAAVQVALKRLGLYNATVDGVRGPMTKSAIVRFQRRRGLAVDGVVGPQTRRAFGKRGRPAFGSRTMKLGDRGWDVAAMQYILARRGYPPGAIDAVFGPMTDTALRNFQGAFGLSADGLAGPADDLGAAARQRHRGGRPGTTPVANGPVRLLRPVPGPDRRPLRRARAQGGRTHTGLDFPVQAGTPVGAAGVGVTEFAGWNTGGYGNLVVVRHRLGYTTWYAHLSSITTWVGEQVTGGTRLGYVGSTGHSTGPHLHFELRKNAVPIDPFPYLLQAVATRASCGGGGRRRRCRRQRRRWDGDRPEHTGGGVAARECPIRKPLVRYRQRTRSTPAGRRT